VEQIDFSDVVTFLHGPVSTGKSTVARLVDFCLGGNLERTPAIQQEFVAAQLSLVLGGYGCSLERAADDNQSVRVTWSGPGGDIGSVNAPLSSQTETLLDDAEVYSLSDLIFHLCGVTPIKVRQRSRDPDSPLIRLSIRDIWWYCYLDQTHLDSSFFRLEDPFRGRKSQDAMRFFTGLHSERLSQLEDDLMRTMDEQRSKREAVQQIRSFMTRFDLGSEANMASQLQTAQRELAQAEDRRKELERTRSAQTHPTDALRNELRRLSAEVEKMRQAIDDSVEFIAEQRALRAEFITAKTKAARAEQAGKTLFEGVRYQRCPECGSDISDGPHGTGQCRLCGSFQSGGPITNPLESEAMQRDLNERIDQIADSIVRRQNEHNRMLRQLAQMEEQKASLDRQLQEELARYDSAFVESMRTVEREIATLVERIRSLQRLQQMPQAINGLEEEAGALQGRIDRLRTSVAEERDRMQVADANVAAIAAEFKRIMLSVSFPGVTEEDDVVIDPRNWKPAVVHGSQEWTFWDSGSGGKKTLFNVCYALAIHAVALERGMPVPDVLIIDSPTKNISEDENPELVRSLYAEIYRLARGEGDRRIQFLLVDSDIVKPSTELQGFVERRMAGTIEAPSLIPYYSGP
jgi:predicted  nucleic acid-binding Zn-ribbon protein